MGRLLEVIGQALNKMSDELTAEALKSMRSDHQQALLDAVMVIRENRLEIESRFRRNFTDVFERRLFALKEGRSAPDAPAELELVSDDVMRDKLSVDRLIGKARKRLDPDEVLGIRARLGALLERDWFDESQHPASPEAVFEALKGALAELSPRPEVKGALLDAFEPHVSSNLNAIYVVVNERLRSHHVLPKIRPQVQNMGSGNRRAPGESADSPSAHPVPLGAGAPVGAAGHAGHMAQGGHSAPGFGGAPLAAGHAFGGPGPAGAPGGSAQDHAAFGSVDQMAALQIAMAQASKGQPGGRMHVARMLSDPTVFGVADIPVAPVEPPLVASLTQLQRGPMALDAATLLPEIVQKVREQGSPLDQITVEIVSMVFDYIYTDRRLPDSIKQQLLRLQVVAVKAALLDRSFFARRQHPMRRLIDRISDLGADPDADLSPGSPLIEGLAAAVDRIIAEFDADLAVFDEAFAAIEALAERETERRAAHLEAIAREAAQQEAFTLAQEQARIELGQRLDKDSPAFMREFLYRWWTQAMARLRTGHTDELAASGAWQAALRSAEYLIWSVAPKQSEDVARLATLLPKLIRALNQGLELVDIPEDERGRFFDELLRAHATEIEAAKKRFQNAEAARIPVSVKLQADGTVKFASSGAQRSLADESPTLSAADTLLQSLRRGQHIELDGDDGPHAYKLAWISPARKLFILTRHPDQALTFQGGEFALLLQRDAARIIDEDSAVDRAIDSVTSDASPSATAATRQPSLQS